MRALIVDDSRFVRDYLRGLLEQKGIECEEAADGKAGLDHLHDDDDVRLFDGLVRHAGHRMPHEAGVVSACGRLRGRQTRRSFARRGLRAPRR